MKKIAIKFIMVFVCATIGYLFLSLCHWSFNPESWSWFSRFILGAIFGSGIVWLLPKKK